MNNDQVMPIVNTIIAAIVTAVVTSDQFKAAVKQSMTSDGVIDYTSDDFKDAVNAIINDDDALIMFDNDKFRQAVRDEIEKYHENDDNFEDRVKRVVSDMSFTTNADRY